MHDALFFESPWDYCLENGFALVDDEIPIATGELYTCQVSTVSGSVSLSMGRYQGYGPINYSSSGSYRHQGMIRLGRSLCEFAEFSARRSFRVK